MSRELNNLGKQKKMQIEAEVCNFYVQPSEFTNTYVHNCFF